MTFRGEMGRRCNLSQAARTKISVVNVSTNFLVRWKHYQAAMIIRIIRIINIILRPGYALSGSNKVDFDGQERPQHRSAGVLSGNVQDQSYC